MTRRHTLAAVLAVAIGSSAAAQALSGGNGKIAFAGDSDGHRDIFVTNADGTGGIAIAAKGAHETAPRWSPDGRQIVFASDRDNGENTQIYVMNADGSDQQRLTAASGSSGSPAWSPDGTRIVFSSDHSDGNLEIYVMDADGSNVTRLTNDAATDHEPVWSPDGTAILFYSDRNGDFEIFVMNADGSAQTPITSDLRLTQTDSADPIEVGDSLAYTLTVSNLDHAPATSAVVTDPTASNNINGTTTQVTTLNTATSLASSVNPSTLSQPVTLTATVAPATADGTVTFYDRAAVLGSRPLVNGQAALTTTFLPAGIRALTARYPGNSSHLPSSSGVSSQTVQARAQDSFHPAVHYPTFGAARAVAVGDVNQDGRADVAVGHGFSLDIRLGTGAGTFQPAVTHMIAGSPRGIAFGDFNADGRPDVALAVTSNAASVLLGNGDGTFQPYVTYAAGDMPSSIAVSDFNNDGRPDLAVTNGDGDNVSVLLGRGDGTFLPQLLVAAGVQPAVFLETSVPGGGGSITASPASASGFYDPGTVVQLTATPEAGYTFSGWTGSISGPANPQSITMAGPRLAFANFTPPSCAANVTSQLNISPGGLQRNTITGRWSQGVTISNRTGTPIVEPLALALDGLSSGVALFDPSGFTACALPSGRPFRLISVGADALLSPGEIINVTLEFTNPLNLRISYTPRALAGPNR